MSHHPSRHGPGRERRETTEPAVCQACAIEMHTAARCPISTDRPTQKEVHIHNDPPAALPRRRGSRPTFSLGLRDLSLTLSRFKFLRRPRSIVGVREPMADPILLDLFVVQRLMPGSRERRVDALDHAGGAPI